MSMVEDNATLFDIIQDALDNTVMQKGTLYVLYDKVGKLTLSKVSSLKVNACLIDQETGEDLPSAGRRRRGRGSGAHASGGESPL